MFAFDLTFVFGTLMTPPARSGGTCTFSDTGVEIDEGRKVVYRYKKIGDEPALMSSNG